MTMEVITSSMFPGETIRKVQSFCNRISVCPQRSRCWFQITKIFVSFLTCSVLSKESVRFVRKLLSPLRESLKFRKIWWCSRQWFGGRNFRSRDNGGRPTRPQIENSSSGTLLEFWGPRIPTASCSWNFGGSEFQQRHAPGVPEGESSSSDTLLEFWGLKTPVAEFWWHWSSNNDRDPTPAASHWKTNE